MSASKHTSKNIQLIVGRRGVAERERYLLILLLVLLPVLLQLLLTMSPLVVQGSGLRQDRSKRPQAHGCPSAMPNNLSTITPVKMRQRSRTRTTVLTNSTQWRLHCLGNFRL